MKLTTCDNNLNLNVKASTKIDWLGHGARNVYGETRGVGGALRRHVRVSASGASQEGSFHARRAPNAVSSVQKPGDAQTHNLAHYHSDWTVKAKLEQRSNYSVQSNHRGKVAQELSRYHRCVECPCDTARREALQRQADYFVGREGIFLQNGWRLQQVRFWVLPSCWRCCD